ncbi:hypothetical protein HN358_00430 [Candidatus Uhrbacteria bacterium]|nr:hypothetical protein [Candidatus Uhrbacteria bacterium]MBT7717692.1 hypothetical protein [Candidatus Uhrbacteria bacterium]
MLVPPAVAILMIALSTIALWGYDYTRRKTMERSEKRESCWWWFLASLALGSVTITGFIAVIVVTFWRLPNIVG